TAQAFRHGFYFKMVTLGTQFIHQAFREVCRGLWNVC
ncbi:hypothetical protein ECPA28_5815, partial [Escherichia coli PA28]